MGKIIEFDSNKKEDYKEDFKEDRNHITLPTLEEIAVLNALTDNYNKDEMVDVCHWNGDCWHILFKEFTKYAEEIKADPWDVLAVFITKMNGTKFIKHEDGSWTVSNMESEG